MDFLAGGSGAVAAARQALAGALRAGGTDGSGGEPLAYRLEDVRLRAPIAPSTKVICMGRTFESHVVIGGLEPHPKPTPFYKLTQMVVGPDDYVVLPKHHYPEPVVYGTELTVVIGKEGRSIAEERAEEYIWGYTVLNDVTMRGAYQTVAKSFDTSAPVGPWIVPHDQIGDPHNLRTHLPAERRAGARGQYAGPAVHRPGDGGRVLEVGDAPAGRHHCDRRRGCYGTAPAGRCDGGGSGGNRGVTQPGAVGGIIGVTRRDSRRARR